MKMMSPTCIPHQAAHANEVRYMPKMVGDMYHRIFETLFSNGYLSKNVYCPYTPYNPLIKVPDVRLFYE
ncbi:hypothetical protein TNIN_78341 [Trichonephila inaurata madagascariensis]|uniref:Uncharacterized protein n=1 Tax=Trichonephila inaurata madagascariensis TaxID=2747483 RepID=A0A8X6MLE3_9ARAC|nr:hypothetical protein TNIN_78341 [Trichonephila inaurata madagascariensis]